MSIVRPTSRIANIIGNIPRNVGGILRPTLLEKIEFPFAIGGDTYTYAQDGKYWRCHMFSQVGSDTLTFLRGGLVEYLVVGGGGGGGGGQYGYAGGGGGAGGLRHGSGFGVKAGVYSISVGDGGAAGTGSSTSAATDGTNGGNSSFGAITAAGGGGGGRGNAAGGIPGLAGGSGGGAGTANTAGTTAGGAGNTPATTPSQGNSGGIGYNRNGVSANINAGGGGGAGAAGGDSTADLTASGGDGVQHGISGAVLYYAGGGAGAGIDGPATGGLGGGGDGVSSAGTQLSTPGEDFVGGGGGGGNNGPPSFPTLIASSGGSGIVIVRYQITQAEFEGDEPYHDNVSLLLNMNGANGSTTFADSSKHRHAVTANGNAQISTAQSKFGGASAEFDGNGDYLNIASSATFGFGTGDFTIECWIYPSTVSGVQVIADFRTTDTGGPGPVLYLNGSTLTAAKNGTTNVLSGGTISANQWQFVTLTRLSSDWYLSVDGTITSGPATDAIDYSGSFPCFVGRNSISSIQFFNGYIDDLRITKGVARYTANFTPPQREFLPDILAGITPSGLLDQYTGAAAAYSLRSLSDAYTGPVVTVRRSSDSAEADFTATEVADGTLEAWCGAGDGLVKTLYDQSGHGRHASQSTATAQPKIVSGGVLVLENGLPAIEFDGSNDYLANTTHNWAVQPTDNLFALCVASPQSTGMSIAASRDYAGTLSYKGWQWRLDASTNYMRILNYNGSVADSSLSNFAPTLNDQSLLVARLASGGDHGVFANGSDVEVTNDDSLTAYTPATDDLLVGAVGIIGGTIGDYLDGTISELIIYPVDQSANRVAIEDNINSHYNVFDPTVLLLHMDGTNGSTTFTDSSLNNFTVTANGNAQISTAQSKFGGASAAFDGAGDYLSVPDSQQMQLGTSDFCIEGWFYFTEASPSRQYHLFFINGDSGGNRAAGLSVRGDAGFSGVLRLVMEDSSSVQQIIIDSPSAFPVNAWTHVAVTRHGAVCRLFIGGEEVGSESLPSASTSLLAGTENWIANYDYPTGTFAFPGYIDDLRITKGRALYTANFTPPTAPHPHL